jgi:hypothetical protein
LYAIPVYESIWIVAEKEIVKLLSMLTGQFFSAGGKKIFFLPEPSKKRTAISRIYFTIPQSFSDVAEAR